MSVRRNTISLTAATKIDFRDILSYTMQTWGQAQRIEYKRKLDQVLQAIIATDPRRRKKRHGLFVYQAGRHRIFYRVEDNQISVLRILHDRMDAGRHLTDT